MHSLAIDPKKETKRIVGFIKETMTTQGFQNVIIASSGGVDSTTSLYLLSRALSPQQIFLVHLPYFTSHGASVKKITEKLTIPQINVFDISIKPIVDETASVLGITQADKVRFGNVMARVRMVVLYDLAKKHHALVCGTENKSEYYLGYFTRFGDQASDFEPIQHVYKTQVYELAKHLGVPQEVIDQKPTAGLWLGQTDEGEFGFTYKEADEVLYLYFDQKEPVKNIEKRGLKNAKRIIDWCKKNDYKHHAPYVIKNQS